jgi:hypothetical protein
LAFFFKTHDPIFSSTCSLKIKKANFSIFFSAQIFLKILTLTTGQTAIHATALGIMSELQMAETTASETNIFETLMPQTPKCPQKQFRRFWFRTFVFRTFFPHATPHLSLRLLQPLRRDQLLNVGRCADAARGRGRSLASGGRCAGVGFGHGLQLESIFTNPFSAEIYGQNQEPILQSQVTTPALKIFTTPREAYIARFENKNIIVYF